MRSTYLCCDIVARYCAEARIWNVLFNLNCCWIRNISGRWWWDKDCCYCSIVTVLNAYILYKKENQKDSVSHVQFRQRFIDRVISEYHKREQCKHWSHPSLNDVNSCRLSARHFVKYFPPTGGIMQQLVAARCTADKPRRERIFVKKDDTIVQTVTCCCVLLLVLKFITVIRTFDYWLLLRWDGCVLLSSSIRICLHVFCDIFTSWVDMFVQFVTEINGLRFLRFSTFVWMLLCI